MQVKIITEQRNRKKKEKKNVNNKTRTVGNREHCMHDFKIFELAFVNVLENFLIFVDILPVIMTIVSTNVKKLITNII